jgi:hypothetical protein
MIAMQQFRRLPNRVIAIRVRKVYKGFEERKRALPSMGG